MITISFHVSVQHYYDASEKKQYLFLNAYNVLDEHQTSVSYKLCNYCIINVM